MSLRNEIRPLGLDDKVHDSEDKKTSRTIALIFTPLAAIIFLTFKWPGLRTGVLYFSAFCLIYLSASSFKKNGYRIKKEDYIAMVMLVIFGLAFFYKFFADLCLIFIGLMLSFIAFMAYLNFKISNLNKVWVANLIFFSSIITAIVLNYRELMQVFHRLK
jgi:hypothetical protein